jgi:fatty-acyl-CoA synthase
VLKDDRAGALAAEDLRAFIKTYADRGIISKFGIPQDIVFLEALKASVGKHNKRALRDACQDERALRPLTARHLPFLTLD